ncbi:UDP-N-acetylmuramate:L-alanyl-gamma-D-glutamyl-meso-diaminopimelate ligase [bacterium]|nr:UDP-N-acetylmuramate:L-alanyl-gamma-D-glutamyl-meso-diaminopimelate ligase [bacterium]
MLPWQNWHQPPRIHFIGIGGTAMVAGARLAIENGWEVRGSDQPLYPPTSDMVKALGVPVYTGYAAENLEWKPDLVLVGNALSRGNPEVEEVLRRNIPYTSLPEWMKEVLLRQRRPVVITGTHGKTTTSALTAFLLDKCGLEPGYLIGGSLLDFPVSSRTGQTGKPFVIEGDEYDTAFFDKRAKFFHYLPEIAVVTSIEFDHGDIYDDIDQIERAFRLMLRQIPPQGHLIACADDPRALSLTQDAPCPTMTYGFHPDAHWRGEFSGYSAGFAGMVVYRSGKRFAELAVPLSGKHNLQNTLAAVAVAAILGATASDIQAALMQFKGVKRRMEVFHQANGVTFVDDFAHHPTAIRETISAAKMRWPGSTLHVLIEPRSNTMVRKIHTEELSEALADADRVYLGPIHRVERIPKEERLDREAIVSSLMQAGVEAEVQDEVGPLVDSVLERTKSGDVVLILSNGAFHGIYELFRERTGGVAHS